MNTAAIAIGYQSALIRRDEQSVSWGLMLLSVFCLLMVMGFKVWVKTECTKFGYELATQMQQTVKLDTLRRDLELQKSILLRPDNLVNKASELGLMPLNPEQARKIRG